MRARARRRPLGARARRGSALVLALVVIATVAGLSVALLRVSSAITNRQSQSTDDKRAFYLAEAGLSEAYFGLMTGNSGQIGSMEAPALVGDGLVWVEATEGEDGLVTLRSTGLCDAGRSTLEIVVEPVRQPLGIFADEGIELTTPFLVDGYDSEAPQSYYEQAGFGKVVVDPTRDYKFDRTATDTFNLYYDGLYYVVAEYDLDTMTFYYTESSGSMAVDADVTFGNVAGTGTTDSTTGWGETTDATTTEPVADGTVASDLGPTTGVGGELGSNGPITLSGSGGSIEIYGDVVPGVDSVVDAGSGVVITGSVEPRSEPLELPPVDVPDVEWLPGFEHDSLVPRVLPSADIGYESIAVAPGSELVVQGAGNLVVGDLSLQPDGALTVENQTGAVNLYVTDSAQLAVGSSVVVGSDAPADLSLQVAQTALSVDLRATSQFHGMVYAPDSHVAIGKDFEVFGMLAANTLEIDAYSRLHFDSGVLGNSGAVPLPRLIGWRIDEIPAEVAQSRMDPFRLLQLDKEELKPLTEAHEQSSWMISVEAWFESTLISNYEGPLEQWVPDPAADYHIWQTLTPPETPDAADWSLYLRYKKGSGKGGQPDEQECGVGELELPMWIFEVYELQVYPPK